MSEQIEVRLTVFKDEDPDLYAWLSSMPGSRVRRRSAYREVMKAGLLAKTDPSLLPQASPAFAPAPSPSTRVAASSSAATAAPEPENAVLPAGVQVTLDMSDLDEVFGRKLGLAD